MNFTLVSAAGRVGRRLIKRLSVYGQLVYASALDESAKAVVDHEAAASSTLSRERAR